MRTTFLFWSVGFALGFACGVIGMKIIEWDRRRKLHMDIEATLRASGRHWRYCQDCERWWFTRRKYCHKCEGEMEMPSRELLVEFTTELLDFWNELTDVTKRAWSENEVAGLLSARKRHAEELSQLP